MMKSRRLISVPPARAALQDIELAVISQRVPGRRVQRAAAGWVSDAQVLRNHEIIRKYSLSTSSLR